MTELRFDDIDGINAAAGGEYGDWGREVEITQDMINQFAELTGDHQWIHVDIERANAGPFGGPIAHGFLTLSLLPVLSGGTDVAITGYSQLTTTSNGQFRRRASFTAHSSAATDEGVPSTPTTIELATIDLATIEPGTTDVVRLESLPPVRDTSMLPRFP